MREHLGTAPLHDPQYQRMRKLVKERVALATRLAQTNSDTRRVEKIAQMAGRSALRRARHLDVFVSEFASLPTETVVFTVDEAQQKKRVGLDGFLKEMRQFQADHPDERINLSQFATKLDVSKQRTNQLYHKAKQQGEPLPQLQHRRTQQERVDLANQVIALRNRGYNLRQIIEETQQPKSRIETCVKVLREQGKWEERIVDLKRQEVEEQVKALREQGFGDKKIIEMIDAEHHHIRNAIDRLRKKGEIPKLRRKRRSKKQLREFQEQVLTLREKGLSNEAIASELGETRLNVNKAVAQLIAEKRTRRKKRSNSKISERLELVKELRRQGLNNTEITLLMNESRSAI